ncbi:rhamnose utilization protein RhaD (predicted bifunctional aldolase and dehydrogenase)/NAD(P)-dependent dehydrogenase (short-subunit alcohol dehydrogenase family) [Deinococcus metalli]|uniref:Rhamnose utilization protein RhaD (Predicted bifunctional aldolase and dehydrogenase)/NAD(P)-dependent dehydrogenase (Short-subunit alcohol dehydrogenase family) n=1 Tax=Deinococcus metalli TaxID=1141878 RepID=A0A7W8NRL7_9DEIO|nr:bifunctional aldolase/short-chain dehydrogenase [Deinococcus metalli]MBB5378020.1 rhamnose utilization protein RhaD (predicted bifunctional aldolase and dehydrogenase)/NAD(P)-dependent dehydrogenase (short-subunit alcohol dehydrogenase family) [Deinococcus metalli]GHF53821.1 short-chain dehydrogenase [Deinococcus metalli]
MRSRWDDAQAAAFGGALRQRVYSSRLLGADPDLVLHGGGNTSVKTVERTLLGDDVETLWVKGSGWDLAAITERGFTPLRLDVLRRLAELETLSDVHMARELRAASLDPAAPAPSVEAILHGVLPARFIDHTHADAFVTLSNTPDGEARVRALYGDEVVVVPYIMPGFALARSAWTLWREHAHAGTTGLALLNHGLFTVGDTAREAYGRMIDLVTRAETVLERQAVPAPRPVPAAPPADLRGDVAALRLEISRAAGRPMLLMTHQDDDVLAYAQRPDLPAVAAQGPATPDHVIRTRRLPLIGRDVAAYVQASEAEFTAHAPRSATPLTMLDPAPRVVLDPQLGLGTVGVSAAAAQAVEDIARHTLAMAQRAEALGGWRPRPAADIFDVEYWDLEQAKLRAGPPPAEFSGEVAVVTGAASGIGRACVDALLRRGAAVIGLDLQPAVEGVSSAAGYLGVRVDLTDPVALAAAVERSVRAFGGLDMLILNAGVFPPGRPIAELGTGEWEAVLKVNLTSGFDLLRLAHPLLRLAPGGGRVVVNASKNVPAPGPGAAAYSASKAALTQLARVAAMEWGADGIRVNVLHPNAVFDTGLWTPEVLAQRARSYGLSVEDYRRNNVLRAEVTSRDVAELACTLCGAAFSRTTGAQVPVDGGNDRVI